MERKYWHGMILVFMVLMVWGSMPSQAQKLQLDEGWWRLELQGAGGVYSGKNDRDGDYYLTGIVEYESPFYKQVTLGLRLYPLLYYYEHDDGTGSSQDIFGTAIGPVLRLYQNPEYHGWFGEAGVAGLFQSGTFDGNDSKFNFLTEVGIGYKFPSTSWHLAVKFSHASNAGIESENSAVNAAVFAVGFSF